MHCFDTVCGLVFMMLEIKRSTFTVSAPVCSNSPCLPGVVPLKSYGKVSQSLVYFMRTHIEYLSQQLSAAAAERPESKLFPLLVLPTALTHYIRNTLLALYT